MTSNIIPKHLYLVMNVKTEQTIIVRSFRELVERFDELQIPKEFTDKYKPAVILFHRIHKKIEPIKKINPKEFISIVKLKPDRETIDANMEKIAMLAYKPSVKQS